MVQRYCATSANNESTLYLDRFQNGTISKIENKKIAFSNTQTHHLLMNGVDDSRESIDRFDGH